MDVKRQLGEFLQARRSQLRPGDVGLNTFGEPRRVTGLRREELAMLAGVSPSYYARLEQSQSANASAEVLDAIATAMRLDDAERRHLHTLAGGAARRAVGRRVAPERVTAAVRQLMETLSDVPAVLLGRRTDVLTWNRTGNALFAGHVDFAAPERPESRPNMAHLIFLDPHTRELYVDWPAKARAAVGTLRLASGQHPDDPALASLIGELTVKSPEFGRMWADHRLKPGAEPVYEMRHPLVGAVTITQQSLRTEHGQHIVLATADIGSPSHAALRLLAHSAAAARRVRPEAPATP